MTTWWNKIVQDDFFPVLLLAIFDAFLIWLFYGTVIAIY